MSRERDGRRLLVVVISSSSFRWLVEDGVERVEPLRPGALVALDPVVDGLERPRRLAGTAVAVPRPGRRPPHVSQHPQVLRDLRLGDPAGAPGRRPALPPARRSRICRRLARRPRRRSAWSLLVPFRHYYSYIGYVKRQVPPVLSCSSMTYPAIWCGSPGEQRTPGDRVSRLEAVDGAQSRGWQNCSSTRSTAARA